MFKTRAKIFEQQWKQFSLAQQLGNIGSEVNRAICWKDKGDIKKVNGSAERVLELIDLTITDKRWSNKLREILFLREVFCDYFFNLSNYNVTTQQLKNYFLPFALIVVKNARKK